MLAAGCGHHFARLVLGPKLPAIEIDDRALKFADVRGCLKKDLKTSGEFAQRLLEEEQTVVTDGAGFGTEGFIRISYATSMEQIQEGIKRIARFAEKYN